MSAFLRCQKEILTERKNRNKLVLNFLLIDKGSYEKTTIGFWINFFS